MSAAPLLVAPLDESRTIWKGLTSAKGAQYRVGYEIPSNEDWERARALIENSNIELGTPAELQTSTDLETAPDLESEWTLTAGEHSASVYVHWVCELDGPGTTHETRKEVLDKVGISGYRFVRVGRRVDTYTMGDVGLDVTWYDCRLALTFSDSRGGVSGMGRRLIFRLFEEGGDVFQVCVVNPAWTHVFGIWAKEWHEPLIEKIEVGE